MRCETLLKIYERHNVDFEKMVQSGSRSPRTLYKYQNVYNLLCEFIRHRYNHRWLVKHRDKTGVESTVPLLDIPAKILQKYSGMAEGDRLLPVPCYVTSTLRANASKRDTTAVRGERGSIFANRPSITDEMIFTAGEIMINRQLPTDDSGPERSDASDIVGSGGIKDVMPVARGAYLTS